MSKGNIKVQSDADLKAKLIGEHEQATIQETKFPTELITLPSKGLVYSEDSPLKSGEIELRYMTAKEEDILTSPNLIKKGIALDKVMQSLIVNKSINFNDIVLGDKNAIMVACRMLAYGKDYTFKTTCPSCGEENTVTVDLTELDDKYIDESVVTKGMNSFDYTLPKSGVQLTYKLLTHSDERKINEHLKAFKKINRNTSTADPEVTTRLKYTIISVDGETDQKEITDFVENRLLSVDSLELRKYMAKVNPDLEMNYHFICDECDYENPEMRVPMTVDFFWPRA